MGKPEGSAAPRNVALVPGFDVLVVSLDLPKEPQLSGEFISVGASSHRALLAHGGLSSAALTHAKPSLVGKTEHFRVLLSFHPDLFHVLLS